MTRLFSHTLSETTPLVYHSELARHDWVLRCYDSLLFFNLQYHQQVARTSKPRKMGESQSEMLPLHPIASDT